MTDNRKKIQRLKCLVVTSDPGDRISVREALASNGFDIRVATDESESINTANQWEPDAVLSVRRSPEADMEWVRPTLSRLRSSLGTPVILILGSPDGAILKDAVYDDFVTSPLDPTELSLRIINRISLSTDIRDLRESKVLLESLQAITKAVFSTLELTDLLNVIVKKVAEAVGAKDCSIVQLKDGDDNEGLIMDSFQELPTSNLRIELDNYPELRQVLQTRTLLAIENIANHPLMEGVKDSVKDLVNMSALVIPIVFDDPLVGTIFLRAKRFGHGFTKKELRLCSLVADASYYAIKNAQIHENVTDERERLKKIAMTDQLTGLYNHNHFYQRLEEEFSRSSRYNTPLSMIMMDIDDFKLVNDTYGHPVGDLVLKQIARILKLYIRKADIAARYGGEEFAIILTYTSAEGAIEEAERIREMVENYSFEELGDKNLTLSLGVATYESGSFKDSAELVNLADKALYKAKRSGKNCVMTLEVGTPDSDTAQSR